MGKSTRVHQAATIPFRSNGIDVQFCLITASSGSRWTIPKGIVDPGETPVETALKETLEEAGLRGRIVGTPVGDYHYRKWGTKLKVRVYLMEVTEQDQKWDEMAFRKRKWCSPGKAKKLLVEHPARRLLKRAINRVMHAID